MTEQPSSDDDAFFEALAGRGTGNAGASALRAALLSEAEVVRLAELAASTQSTPEQTIVRQRIRDALVAEGLLPHGDEAAETRSKSGQAMSSVDLRSGTTRAASAGRSRAASVLTNLLERFRSWSVPQLAGLAASCMLGAVVLVRLGGGGAPEAEDAMRGGQVRSVHVANPAQFGGDLAARINAAGGEATLVQLSETAWMLSVNTSRDAALPAVQALLRQAGVDPNGPPPYEVQLLRAAPSPAR